MRRTTAAALIATLAILVALAVVALFVFSDDDEPERVVAPPVPTGTPPAPAALSPPVSLRQPTATIPPPLPTLEPGPGRLVFLKDEELWVAPLDGSATPRMFASGGLGSRYAGYVQRPGRGIELYYMTQLIERPMPSGDRGDFAVYRVALSGGTPEELVRFEGRAFRHPLSRSQASVSPDGQYLAYVHGPGLAILDLTSGATQQVLQNGACDGPVFETCWDYRRPEWSPDGRLLKVSKVLWEGSLTVLIAPFETPLGVTETLYSGASTWSLDGQQLCIRKLTYLGLSPTLVYDVATGKSSDTSINIPVPTPATSSQHVDAQTCAWAEGGLVAVGYIVDRVPGSPRSGFIAVVDSALNLVTMSDPIEDFVGVVAWLPDESGIMFYRSGQLGELLPSGVFDLEKGIVDLPFEADKVLGLIPWLAPTP